tara:strand:+ start:10150 stop:10401 length:252 start_codon:yes stop_codon:yes gene_type:complete
MLKKQSIRKEHTIYLGGVKMEKEEIIEISKDFTEKELLRFKKMLQQGGSIKIKGLSYNIIKNESKPRNSRGDYESPMKLMDRE